MDRKTIEIKFHGFLSDGGVMGIQDNLSYPIIPYWISNPTGATLRKIKMMIYNIQSFDSLGGSITLKIYSAPVSTYSQQLTRDIVFQEAELINEIAITGDEPVLFVKINRIKALESVDSFDAADFYLKINIDNFGFQTSPKPLEKNDEKYVVVKMELDL